MRVAGDPVRGTAMEDGSRQSGVADVSSKPSDLLGCVGSSCYSDSLVGDVMQRRARELSFSMR